MIGFFVAGCLRYCLVLHETWLVNSAAHLNGIRPYDDSINPAENRIVAFLALEKVGIIVIINFRMTMQQVNSECLSNTTQQSCSLTYAPTLV